MPLVATPPHGRSRLFILSLAAVLFSAFFIRPGVCAGEAVLKYDVAWEGVSDRKLRSDLKAASRLLALKDHPPAIVGVLNRRAEEDVPRFINILRGQGYYGAGVSFDIDEEKKPILVTYHVETGPVYRIASVDMTLAADEEPARRVLPSPADLGLKKGQPARAAIVLDAQKKIEGKLQKNGYPLAKVSEKQVVVDHKTKEVSVAFLIHSGPPARFGPTTITGLQSVDEKFVRGKITWQRGEKFNSDLVTEFRKRLTRTELFSLVQVTHADSLTSDGELPMTVKVRERKRHTVSLGARYYTDEGPGGKVSWEDRNLFHGGERLKFSAIYSFLGYSGEASYTKPEFLRNDQTLTLLSKLAHDDTDAYKSNNLDSTVTVERQFGREENRIGLGPGFRVERMEDKARHTTEDFALPYLNSYLNWDTTDNMLDPTRGGRLTVKLAPYFDTLDSGVGFFKAYGNYSRYFRLVEEPSIIFATRAALGFIAGADRDRIPADLRYYAGGGSSVRGYPYQTLSPLLGNTPLGGASLFEVSFELRAKVTEHFGVVTFLDGGFAFEPSYPDFSEPLRWGAGVGVRYFTPFGPLRLDVATPLERRPGVDGYIQVYISLGQAF
jgi:translocation and assembly module TamA